MGDLSDTHRSIKTFMIYLNDEFEGGHTRFYSEDQCRYHTGLPENLLYALRPEKGSCLIFNHRIVHDGEELLQGLKYILRTEVMYRHRSAFSDRGDDSDRDDDSDSDFDCEGQGI